MFGFRKNKSDTSTPDDTLPPGGWISRLKQGLAKTRTQLSEGLKQAILGKKSIDLKLLEEIESQLLLADVGVDATQRIIDQLTTSLSRHELKDPQAVLTQIQEHLYALLQPCALPLSISGNSKPFVVLVVGVNGAGKTTTIGKLTHYYTEQGLKVMLAAGDTFRAAAVEQLQTWGARHNVPVVAQHTGADSASVIFDALASARAKNMDLLIADTAGRLHTQSHLMEELKKVKRVMSKLDPTAPHEVLLVLDAGTGQNALSQAKEFHHAVGVTGIALTKLDGTAKGGVIFSLAERMKIPIRFIGVGEKASDLREFKVEDFVTALFEQE